MLDAARERVSTAYFLTTRKVALLGRKYWEGSTYLLTYLLGQGTADGALRRHNGTTSEACAHALVAAAHTRPARERARLRRALSHGLSPPEAMLAAAPGGKAS